MWNKYFLKDEVVDYVLPITCIKDFIPNFPTFFVSEVCGTIMYRNATMKIMKHFSFHALDILFVIIFNQSYININVKDYSSTKINVEDLQ